MDSIRKLTAVSVFSALLVPPGVPCARGRQLRGCSADRRHNEEKSNGHKNTR
jgi:hypothetical protein